MVPACVRVGRHERARLSAALLYIIRLFFSSGIEKAGASAARRRQAVGAWRGWEMLSAGSSKAHKSHWISDSKATHCAFDGCGKAFSMRIRRHNCRMCGLVFCDEHSSRRLRLGADGKPGEHATGDPVRVCETCFGKQHAPAHQREEERKPTGTALRLHVAGEVCARDRTQTFVALRAAHNARQRHASEPPLAAYGRLCEADHKGPLSSKRVVAWEPDSAVAACNVCHRGFTPLLRRHHCRLCGHVVCADCSGQRKALPQHGGFAYKSCTPCDCLLYTSPSPRDS